MLTERRHKLDDRNLGFGDDLDALSEVGSTKDRSEGVKDGDLVLTVHAVGLDDEIDITVRESTANTSKGWSASFSSKEDGDERKERREGGRREESRAHPVGRYNPVSKLPNGMTLASGHWVVTALRMRATMWVRVACSVGEGEM